MALKFRGKSFYSLMSEIKEWFSEEPLFKQATEDDTATGTTLSYASLEDGYRSGFLLARGRLKKLFREAEPVLADSEAKATEAVTEEEDPVLTAPPPEPQPEPVTEKPAPEPEPEEEVVATDPEPEPAPEETEPDTAEQTPEPTPKPEPEEEVAAADPEPEPAPEETEPDTAEQTPEPTPEPEPEEEEEVAATDPEPEPEPEETAPVTEDPVVEDPAPGAEDTTSAPDPVSVTRQVAPTVLDNSGPLTVSGGRVTTLSLPEAGDIAGVKITSLPEFGNVTVNPDFTLALVLSGSDYSGPLSFDYDVTHSDGSVSSHTVDLSVSAPLQQAGWGLGDHYMLATDANDKIVVEHGDNHRKVYVSGSDDALTRADIAAREGLSESQITGKWLSQNPEYGGTEGMALAADVGMELWAAVSPFGSTHSNWLLFERGYSYTENDFADGWATRLIPYAVNGESELAPIHITSWGSGELPILGDAIKIYQEPNSNIVFTELALADSFRNLSGSNVIVSEVHATGGLNIQNVSGFTIRESRITDATPVAPDAGQDYWSGTVAGMYITGTDGILIDNNLFHHNGWEDDYMLDGSTDGGAPPNMFSHNMYLQNDTTDATLTSNVFSQGSSVGAHIRGGSFAQSNLFLDNNVQTGILGGDYEGAGHIGNFSLFMDNLITSAGYKTTSIGNIGALDWGLEDIALQTSYLNNIIAHEADPNNPDEIAWKSSGQRDPFKLDNTPFYDNTKVYNWNGYDTNLEGLDAADLNQITIQNFAAEFLGLTSGAHPDDEQMAGYYKSGWIYALMDYARAHWGDGTLTAGDIIEWFQAGFGFEAAPENGTHHRFIPNDLGDGIRWDNKLNWSSDQVPDDGDTVDLGGNWVNYSGTTSLEGLDLGTGGKLQVGQGKLTVDTLETGENGGMLFIERAGQFWTEGYDGDEMLSVEVTGGRFANTGDISGSITMSVQDGQAILGADDARFSIGDGSELRIEGSEAKVGFDGAEGGIATLNLDDNGTLSFVADETGMATLQEFRSGAWDQAGSAVRSGVALDGNLSLDLSNFIGTGTMQLIEVDALAGIFDTVSIHGLGDNRDAELVIDYAADLVTLQLSSGTGQSSLSTVGDALDGSDEDAALWEDLTLDTSPALPDDTAITVFDEAIDPLHEMSFL